MHKNISVAVATRHRWQPMKEFVDSFMNTTDYNFSGRPALTMLLDSPDKLHTDYTLSENDFLTSTFSEDYIRSVLIPEKSGLAELWNWCVMLAPTDWVLICNDDATFKPGWLEYLEEQIATDKFDMIHLLHYGGMCLHKRLILKMGWFDENFRGGGFEDNDHQLRIFESGIKDRINRTQDYKFMDHHKDVSKNGSWRGENNAPWLCQKWGRRSYTNFRIPSFRRQGEVDWHPAYTKKYEEKYGIKSQIEIINKDMIDSNKEIYH